MSRMPKERMEAALKQLATISSEDHAKDVAHFLVEHYLGVQDEDEDRSLHGISHAAQARAETAAAQVLKHLENKPKLSPEQAEALLARVRARQAAVGYDSYASWMARVKPPDAE